jgi:hypothetical protein
MEYEQLGAAFEYVAAFEYESGSKLLVLHKLRAVR